MYSRHLPWQKSHHPSPPTPRSPGPWSAQGPRRLSPRRHRRAEKTKEKTRLTRTSVYHHHNHRRYRYHEEGCFQQRWGIDLPSSKRAMVVISWHGGEEGEAFWAVIVTWTLELFVANWAYSFVSFTSSCSVKKEIISRLNRWGSISSNKQIRCYLIWYDNDNMIWLDREAPRYYLYTAYIRKLGRKEDCTAQDWEVASVWYWQKPRTKKREDAGGKKVRTMYVGSRYNHNTPSRIIYIHLV